MSTGPITGEELRTIDLFDELSDEQLAEWVAVAVPLSVAAGEVIAEQGGMRGAELLLEGVVARDPRGFILAGRDAQNNGWPLQREPYPLETTVPGVFVAGDVRSRSIKRVAAGVGEGSMAIAFVHQYLQAQDPR